MQYFMLFPIMYSKLGHKLTNVKTASINKVLIAFVHRITLRKHLYLTLRLVTMKYIYLDTKLFGEIEIPMVDLAVGFVFIFVAV
jgi:hypothetical protein